MPVPLELGCDPARGRRTFLIPELRPANLLSSIYDRGNWDDSRDMGFDLVPTDQVRELGIPTITERVRERVGAANVAHEFLGLLALGRKDQDG